MRNLSNRVNSFGLVLVCLGVVAVGCGVDRADKSSADGAKSEDKDQVLPPPTDTCESKQGYCAPLISGDAAECEAGFASDGNSYGCEDELAVGQSTKCCLPEAPLPPPSDTCESLQGYCAGLVSGGDAEECKDGYSDDGNAYDCGATMGQATKCCLPNEPPPTNECLDTHYGVCATMGPNGIECPDGMAPDADESSFGCEMSIGTTNVCCLALADDCEDSFFGVCATLGANGITCPDGMAPDANESAFGCEMSFGGTNVCCLPSF